MTSASFSVAGSRCLVTGGTGLIGSHVVDALIARGAGEVVVMDNMVRGRREHIDVAKQSGRVRLVEADLRDDMAVREAMRDVDFVFHEAALWLRQCQADPRLGIDVNVIGTFNIFEAAVKAGVKKVVYASSSSVYGDGRYFPTDEDHPFDNAVFYGMTKIAGEQLARCFRHEHGLPYVALRYLNIYGPRQPSDPKQMDVVMHFATRIREGLPPRITGDGTAGLDLVYVTDCAEANLLALESSVSEGAFNVSSGRETTLKELATTMLAVAGRSDLTPEFIPAENKLVSRRFGTADRARDVLGFTAKVGVEAGVRQVYEWFMAQPV